MKKNINPERRYLIDRLGYARSQAGLSARDLSLSLGYSVAYIAKFENGDFKMPAEVLLNAIEICGMTPEEFFFHDIKAYGEVKEFLSLFESLSAESKSTIKQLLKNLK